MKVYSYVGGSVAPKLNIAQTQQDSGFSRQVQASLIKHNIVLCFWTCLAISLMTSCVFFAKNVFYFSQDIAKAKLARFLDNKDFEFDFLDETMKQFTLDDIEGFDVQGNILDKNGNPIETSKLFKDPISYQTYTVKSGETIDGICKKFGLSNISTLIAVNNISNVRALRQGQKLQIPSCDGLIHTVKKGQTLASLSAKYDVAMEDLLDVNELSCNELKIGEKLFVPGAKLDTNTLKAALGELFIMPLSAKFHYSSMFGTRKDPFTGVSTTHKGIDMACPQGTPIKACCGGTVAMTSYSNLYGNYVIINHGNGYQTLYGHMSKKIAKAGQVVHQGQIIGYVGSTGYSTGPHLHLSVYKNNKVIDPLSVLKTK